MERPLCGYMCDGTSGYATITISKPTTAEYEPHILTVFRTAKNAVELSFVARDSNGIVADQRSPVTLQWHARRLTERSQSLPLSNFTGANGTQESVRRLYGMRRRMSSSMRRRGGGGIKPVNFNPMGWFSPRRRRALTTAAGAAGATALGGMAAGSSARRRGTAPTNPYPTSTGGSYSSIRRRMAPMGTMGMHRRRSYQTQTGYGGSYSNPYSSYGAPYGYPSSSWAYQSFGGHMPTATSYGYTGANAYSGSSGLPIALAAGAGLLAGYAMGHHSHYNHYWHGYSQTDMYKMQCASGPAKTPTSGSVFSCVFIGCSSDGPTSVV